MAYAILMKQGISADNVIYMTSDTLYNDDSNPLQNSIYSWPTGPNSYVRGDADYTGDDVSKANFLGVLKGDATAVPADKPVLKTDANSKIFVFYSGGFAQPGCAFFPYRAAAEDCLSTEDLTSAISYMSDNNLYKEMVIYWASDYSGNMFA